MTAKKSTSKSDIDKKPKAEATLTRAEYERYFERTHDAIYALALLVAGGRYPSESRPEDASAWACMSSNDKFDAIDTTIMERWHEHGEKGPVMVRTEEITELRKSYAPAFSFCNFVRQHDVSGQADGVISQSAGEILKLAQAVAEEGFTLLNSRLSGVDGVAR